MTAKVVDDKKCHSEGEGLQPPVLAARELCHGETGKILIRVSALQNLDFYGLFWR